MKNYSVTFFFFFGKKKKVNVFRRVHHFSLYERCDREGDISIAIQKIQLFSTFYSVLLFSLHLAIVTKVFLLNENHKFSVEILKPRASSKNFSTATNRPVWGTSFHARFTRGRRFESDLGLFRLNSQEAMVRAHF